MTREPSQVLCNIAELADNTARAFQCDAAPRDLFVVRHNNRLFAYLNSCPHTGAPLDWMPGQLLNRDGDLIQCAMHGALFRIADGYCIAGPCVGMRLTSLTVAVIDEKLVLAHDPG